MSIPKRFENGIINFDKLSLIILSYLPIVIVFCRIIELNRHYVRGTFKVPRTFA